jgi:hypothetical protein
MSAGPIKGVAGGDSYAAKQDAFFLSVYLLLTHPCLDIGEAVDDL